MSRSRHTSFEKLEIITEYQHQDKPLSTFARTKQIDIHTLKRWIGLYKRDGIDGLEVPINLIVGFQSIMGTN